MYQRVDELRVSVVEQRGHELHARTDEGCDHLGDEVIKLRGVRAWVRVRVSR